MIFSLKDDELYVSIDADVTSTCILVGTQVIVGEKVG